MIFSMSRKLGYMICAEAPLDSALSTVWNPEYDVIISGVCLYSGTYISSFVSQAKQLYLEKRLASEQANVEEIIKNIQAQA